jgi:N-acetylneuraminate synthase
MQKINKPFIIGEIGINHNGDINIAKELILNAKKANFDAVKFQKRDIDLVYSKEILDTYRESPWGTTQREQKKGLEFGLDEYKEIDQFCKKNEIKWFASAWDENSLKFLDQFDLEFHKIASAMIVDLNFLNAVAERGKYTFISTGMSEKKQIEEAIKIFKSKKCDFELMHCVSTYPMRPEDANLLTIKQMKEIYQCKVGYSGHENGVAVSLMAMMMDISSLERHITLDRTMYGSDQAASLEFSGMQNLTTSMEKMLISLGQPSLGKILEEEKSIAKKLRAHIKN